MSEIADNLARGFAEEIHGQPDHLLELIEPSEAFELGRRAGRELIAAIVWSRSVGDTLETHEVTGLLGISRQALAKRLVAGTMLGLPGKNTTIYPSWQFDLEQKRVRPELRAILQAFAALMGHRSSLAVATWAVTPQSEDLDGLTPAEWLAKGNDIQQLLAAARRTAERASE